MKIILSFLTFYFLCQLAVAQDSGLFYDYDWKEGYYFDKNDNKFEGLIRVDRTSWGFKARPGKIKFKKTKGDAKQTIEPNLVKVVKIGGDSLVSFPQLRVFPDNIYIDFNLVKVVDTGHINLYYYEAISHNFSPHVYFTASKWGGNVNYITTSGKDELGKNKLLNLVKDRQDLVEIINNSKRKWRNVIPTVIKEYNKGKLKEGQ